MASRIAERLGIPHIELDALHWGPDWTPAPTDIFRMQTAQALGGEAWAVDGNYSQVRDIIWEQADTIVWLDYPLHSIMWQLARRTARRLLTREVLWNENRESFRAQFFSRESLFLWALQTYARRKREYSTLLAQPELSHLRVVRLPSPRAGDQWLASLIPITGSATETGNTLT
jgi:adenylate kinase family enzyme